MDIDAVGLVVANEAMAQAVTLDLFGGTTS